MGHLLPDGGGKQTLAEQIKQLKDKVDLTKPLTNLSDGVRAGGNLGAHFNEDREPDRELVEAMLDLLEYLMEYVFTLPAMTQRLDKRLHALQSRPRQGEP